MNHLLQLLADGQFHSGEELGAVLGVSRSAVWKCLQRLEAESGIELFRVPGKGYRLAEPLSLLVEERFGSVLSGLGWGCVLVDTVDSTNAEALRRLVAGVPAPFVVTAEHQTAGRGRRGRTWMSPPAHNILYTLAIKVHGGPQRLAGLSLVAGLAVLRALRDAGIANAGLKWPNDIYVADKKVAGILLEMTGDPADVCHVVIGIGVNVNLLPGALAIEQPWTSMRIHLGALIDRNDVICLVSESLHHYLGIHEQQGFVALRNEWEQNNIWQGKHCTLSTGSLEIAGKVLGVDDQGALRLLVGEEVHIFSGGELSLRLAHDS